MPFNVQIVFYSMYGHTMKMAMAIAEGARSVEGATVELLQVPDLVSGETSRASDPAAHVAVATVDHLADADAIIFGSPTRYGNVIAQMQAFLDQTGPLWAKGTLIGKVGSVFTSTATQHGGQETTIRALHTELLHHGMVIVGVPYSCQEQMTLAEISGGSPYGASTIAGGKGERQPSENELKIARFQGKHVAEIAKKLKA